MTEESLRQAIVDLDTRLYQLETGAIGVVALPIRYVAPTKPQDGIYYADGTRWNPGSGKGIYRYDESVPGYTFIA